MEKLEYQIIRSNRKTLSLSVTRTGEVVVRAPYSVSAAYIAKFVERHRVWLERRLERSCPALELGDGARLTLFGSEYQIMTGKPGIERGRIFLPADDHEGALIKLLKKFSLEVMGILTERIARRYGFRYSKVRISSARGRWGSCNREGVIAYTFRIAFLDPALCEYVAVHELAHTVCFNHSPEFWSVVGDVLPDWKKRRSALKSCTAIEFL